MNKQGLDERQVHARNRIGSQTFLMLMYLLLIDAGLYGFGFRWISYPANIMIILSVCSGIYVVRLIMGNAYVGPSPEKGLPVLRAVLTGVIAMLIAVIILVLIRQQGFSDPGKINDMTAPILFITAATGIIISAIASRIKKKQNQDQRD